MSICMYYNTRGNSQLYPGYRNSWYYNMDKEDYRMTIEGKGSISTAPDIAYVTLGVVSENKDLSAAQQENAIKTNKVINALLEMGIIEKDIQTVAYTIQPVYSFINGKRNFETYKVTNRMIVSINEIDRVGEIIDNAVGSGANLVDNIRFSLLDPSLYYNRALGLAIENAVKKATGFEDNLSIIVNKTPIKITEESYKYTPRDERLFDAPIRPTPIKVGEITIEVRIKAVFTYFPKNMVN